MNGKKIFVSGAAGVIGSELIPLLVEEGAKVMCGDLVPVPKHFPRNIIYRQGDLNYLTQEEIDLFNPEIFIHLAATFERSTESYGHWEENFWHNVRLSNHLMTLIRNVEGIKRVVNASSYLIYAKSLYQFDKPKNEPIRLKETDPINPRNLTGLAKLSHEIELDFLAKFKSAKFTSVSARIYRGYGKNSRDVISRWVRDALNGKSIQVYNPDGFFDYMYAEDTARGLLKLAKINYQGIVNLGTGRSRKVQDVVTILKRHFPKLKANYIETDEVVEASEANVAKLKQLTNWLPEKHLEETIPDIIEFERKRNPKKETDNRNILVTSSSSKVSLVRNVRTAAEKMASNIKIFGGDMDRECTSRFFVDNFWEMPLLNELSAEKVKDYCLKNKIGVVIPSRDGELLFFAQNKDYFSRFGIHIMVSAVKSVENCIDKLSFYRENKTRIPNIIPAEEDIDQLEEGKYVVKERYGSGSLSIGINLSRQEALDHAKGLAAPIYQPYIKGKEYSVDAYVAKKSDVKGVVMRERVKVVNGESQITTTYSDHALENALRNSIENLNLYGHIVLQVIVTEGGSAHIIECNPRFGGASSLSIQKGLDSFYWTLLESRGVELTAYPFVRKERELTQIKHTQDKYILADGSDL